MRPKVKNETWINKTRPTLNTPRQKTKKTIHSLVNKSTHINTLRPNPTKRDPNGSQTDVEGSQTDVLDTRPMLGDPRPMLMNPRPMLRDLRPMLRDPRPMLVAFTH